MLNTMKNNFSSSLERKIQGYGKALAVETECANFGRFVQNSRNVKLINLSKTYFCNYGSLSHYGHFRGLDVML